MQIMHFKPMLVNGGCRGVSSMTPFGTITYSSPIPYGYGHPPKDRVRMAQISEKIHISVRL